MEISWFLITQYGGHPLHNLWEELQNKTKLNIHISDVHSSEMITCNECGKEMKNKKHL